MKEIDKLLTEQTDKMEMGKVCKRSVMWTKIFLSFAC